MRMSKERWAGLAWLLMASAGWAQAQGVGSFLITVRDEEGAAQVLSGGLVEVKGRLGQAKDVWVEIQYGGLNSGEVAAAALTGSADFRIAEAPPVPAVLGPGERAVWRLRYEPTSGSRTLAQVAVTARELPPAGSGLQPGPFGQILVALRGAVADVKLAYALATDGNVVGVGDGGVIRIEKAPVDASTLVTVFVVNQGTAAARLESVELAGAEELKLNALPLLPLDVAAGGSVQFRVRYEPKGVGEHAAVLRVTVDGVTAAVRVEAASQGAVWRYAVMGALGGEEGTAVEAGGVVDAGEVEIGRRKRVWVRVRNEGNAEGVLAGVAVSGPGWAVVDPPLPQTVVKAGGEVWFGLSVTGVEAGRQTGRLRVGADTFVLSVMAVGAVLEYSYVAGGVTVVEVGGQVAAPPAAVGQMTALEFVVDNRGNRAARIESIGVSGKAFRLVGLPELPVEVEPDGQVSFRVDFTPVVPGLNTAVLSVGTAFFNLAGTAADLPELPGYQWEGLSGTVAPMTQGTVGLSLERAYPVALRGSVTMTVDAVNFGADPAVQFSTGGRVVSFVIPAGETRAVFGNGSQSVRLQTGTAAGRIVLTASFATEEGINLTPAERRALELTVPEQAPVVLAARLEASPAAVQVVVTGYSTTRSLTKMEVTIRRRTGKSETFTFDVGPAAQLWFGSAASLGSGGLFSATAPFSVIGSTDDRNKLLEELEGVSVKLTNERGTSAEFTAPAG